jgi:LysR family transcriptional regulator, regulator for metE and metH
MIEIHHIKLLTAIVEQGSLTKAADKLCLTQPALSHQLKELEAYLGIPMCKRINKRLVLTEEGKLIVSKGNLIVEALLNLEKEVKFSWNTTPVYIKISTECYTCYHWLPEVISKFKQQTPQIEVQVVAEATLQPLQYLQNDRLDIAISTTLPQNFTCKSELLFSDELKLVVSASHPLAQKKAFTMEDIAGETLIVYDIEEGKNYVISHILKPAGVYPFSIMRMQLTEAIVEMVSANIGISILADWAIRPYLHTRKLVTRHLPLKGTNRSWFALYRDQTNEPLKDFIQYAKQVLNQSY